MGSYDHGLQMNKIIDKDEQADRKESLVSESSDLVGISVENGSRPMKFLQRVIKSILRQMNVQSHVFGPGEAITIDLQAEIKYSDYIILNKFANAEEHQEPDKYLTKVDDVVSNLIHVVEQTSSRFELESFFNLPIFCSLKFWLVMMTVSVVCFMIIMLSLRAVHATSNASMLLYGFLIIFILSCIWTFSFMYEEAKATNYAKLIQAQTPPKDCEFENLNFRDSVKYFFRVQIFGYKDQCEQYYSATMTDPFWSVNPLEAISKSFSVLVFSPFGYIGDKLGAFLGGLIHRIPIWLQPLLVLLIFGFTFLSLFGYRVVSPFLTLEPSRHQAIEPRSPPSAPPIADRSENELVERPEQKVVKSMRDASTDMNDFEDFLKGVDDNGPSYRARGLCWLSIQQAFSRMWNLLLNLLDMLFRRCPNEVPRPPEMREDILPQEFDFPENQNVRQDPPAANNSDRQNPTRQQIQIEDVLIPRRRMHIRLEKGIPEDKENQYPQSSSSQMMESESIPVVERPIVRQCETAPKDAECGSITHDR